MERDREPSTEELWASLAWLCVKVGSPPEDTAKALHYAGVSEEERLAVLEAAYKAATRRGRVGSSIGRASAS